MRIGLLGGTFDPIHNGHIRLAQEIRYTLSLEQIWLIPSNIPPHREKQKTSLEHRVNMCKIVADSNYGLSVSEVESSRKGVSYAVDTITILNKQYPYNEFFYIIGSDAMVDFFKWKSPFEIINLCNIVAVNRPGVDISEVQNLIEFTDLGKYKDKITIATANTIDVSSTQIRESLQKGQYDSSMLPEEIINYIKENNLYNL